MQLGDIGNIIDLAKELLKEKDACEEKAKEYHDLFDNFADVVGRHLQTAAFRACSGAVETESEIDSQYREYLLCNGFTREEAIQIICAKKSRPINFNRG